jgi:hypothetical protein
MRATPDNSQIRTGYLLFLFNMPVTAEGVLSRLDEMN